MRASGNFSKDDSNGNDDARNNDLIGWMRKNRAARVPRILVQYDVVCQMKTWNFQICIGNYIISRAIWNK